MKLKALAITVTVVLFGIAGGGGAHAGLVARDIDGNSVTDAYYDTDLNITWLSNANINGPMNWSNASAWANNLTFGGLSGWRLPKGDDCHIGPCTSSTNEMSHLYYFELGNPEGGPTSNKGGFTNLQLDPYWTNKVFTLSGYASEVSFLNGDTGHLPISFLRYAMAVRDGDVVTTCTPPKVLQNGVCVTPSPLIPISTSELAALSFDVYNKTGTQGDKGTSRLQSVALIQGKLVPGLGNLASVDGFKANIYKDTLSNQVVVAVRGTSLDNAAMYNLLADASFEPDGKVTALLTSYAKQAADLIRGIYAADPSLAVTLTGHSLGGAIAQIVGSQAHIAVTSFDAPGAKGTLNYDGIKASLSGLDKLNIKTPSTIITDYRLEGDQFSNVGRVGETNPQQLGDTISVKNPNAKINAIDFLDYHDMFTLLAQIGKYCPTGNLSVGCVSGYTGEKNIMGTLIIPIGKGICNIKTLFLQFKDPAVFINGLDPNYCENVYIPALVAKQYAKDPDPGRQYYFQEIAGSPFIRDVYLPTLPEVFGWALQYHDEFGWSDYSDKMGSADFLFSSDVDAVSFIPLDEFGNHTYNPNYFVYGLTFASDGTVNAVEAAFGTVPEPSVLLLFATAGVALVFVYRRRKPVLH